MEKRIYQTKLCAIWFTMGIWNNRPCIHILINIKQQEEQLFPIVCKFLIKNKSELIAFFAPFLGSSLKRPALNKVEVYKDDTKGAWFEWAAGAPGVDEESWGVCANILSKELQDPCILQEVSFMERIPLWMITVLDQ